MKKMSVTSVLIFSGMLAVAASVAAGDVVYTSSGPSDALPPNAVPGQCYARVIVPAEYRDVSEQVIKKEATETVKIIPARYETQLEQVTVSPTTTRIVEVPATYRMVDRQIEVSPARQEWRVGECNVKSIVNNATGECWCLHDVPAVMKTVHEKVVAEPASTRTIDIPAEYESVSKQVMVEPERQEHIAVPAVYGTVTHRELVKPESVDWVRIDCPGKPAPKPQASTGWYSFPRLDAPTR